MPVGRRDEQNKATDLGTDPRYTDTLLRPLKNTSLNAVLRKYLESYVDATRHRRRAVNSLLDLSRTVQAGRGTARWTRDELHDRSVKVR